MIHARCTLGLVCMLAFSACHRAPRTALDFPDEFPQQLSDWHLLEPKGGRLVLNHGVVPYDLNSPLFSDYAHKLRAVLVPPGTTIRYGRDGFDFPVGTVITKTFYYPRVPGDHDSPAAVGKVDATSQGESLKLADVRLLETRLLVKTPSGWEALPYVWDAEQKEATLALAGDAFQLELVSNGGREPFTYLVPDANQCAGCHALDHRSGQIEPIGIRARHLNKDYQDAAGTQNQLQHWQRIGLLTGAEQPRNAPRNARWDQADGSSVEARARAYLDVNCGHCHRPLGAANTSGMLLNAEETDPARLGVCKIPVATGRGSGTALFDIVPGAPDESILVHRMASTEPDVAMPEVGRSLVHREGLQLIRDWIGSMRGSCPAAQILSPPEEAKHARSKTTARFSRTAERPRSRRLSDPGR